MIKLEQAFKEPLQEAAEALKQESFEGSDMINRTDEQVQVSAIEKYPAEINSE